MENVFLDFSKHAHQTFQSNFYTHNSDNSNPPTLIFSCTVKKEDIKLLNDILIWKPLKKRKDYLNFHMTIVDTVVKGFGRFSRFEAGQPDYEGSILVKVTFIPIEYSVMHYENAIRSEKINNLTNCS